VDDVEAASLIGGSPSLGKKETELKFSISHLFVNDDPVRGERGDPAVDVVRFLLFLRSHGRFGGNGGNQSKDEGRKEKGAEHDERDLPGMLAVYGMDCKPPQGTHLGK